MKKFTALMGLFIAIGVIAAPLLRLAGGPLGGQAVLAARSIDFPGDAAVVIPSSSSINFTTEASLSMWVKYTNSGSGGNAGFFGKSNYTESKRCYALESWLGVGTRALILLSADGTVGKSYYNSQPNINDDEWHHIGWTFDEGTFQIYIDTVPYDMTVLGNNMAVTSLNVDATTKMTIASLMDGTATPINFYTGKGFRPTAIDKALTQTEWNELYNLDKNAGTVPGNINNLSFRSHVKASYAFDTRDTGGTVIDDSGNGNTGTYSGDAGDYSTDVPNNQSPPVFAIQGADGRYIDVTHSSSLNCSTQMSAYIIVENNGTGGGGTTGERVMFSKADYGAGKRSWFVERSYTGGTTFMVFLSDDGGAAKKRYESSVSMGTSGFHGIGWTWNNGTLKLFMDGVEDTGAVKHTDTAMTTLYQDASIPVIINSILNNGTHALVWNGATDRPWLSCTDIGTSGMTALNTAMFAKQNFFTNNVLQFKIQWGFDTVSSFQDISGNGNHGTGTGFTNAEWINPGVF